MSRTDFSSMDVWQDDRCRDFITLNVIRRLRYYHDTLHHSNEQTNDYDNIPISAICQHDRLTENDNIDECNRVRAQNLLLLPRALPDCRPCCAEDQTILQELFLHQKEAEQKREVEFKKLAEKRKLLLEENFSDYHPHSDKNETEDSFLHQHNNNNNNNNHQGNNNCAVNLARILFYGKNSFISSLSNRFTVSSHLSESNSNFNHHHQNSNSMEGLAPTPLHYKNKNTTHPDKNSETEIGKEEETVQAVLFDHTPEKQKVDNKEENTTITTTTNTNADTPSPIAPTASDRNNNNNEEEDNGNSCEVCTVLIQHFQNMLQRGIVLDRYSSKDLLFCWWVLGKEMDLRFIYENSNLTNNNNNSDEVVTKLSIKRESLLILLRDFYYSLLSKYYGNNNNNNNNEQSGAPHATTAEGTAAHSHQDENHQNNTNSNTTRHRNDRSKRQSAPADNEIVKRSARLERNRMEKLEKEEMNAPLVPLTGEAAKAAPEKERRGRKRKREEEKDGIKGG
ncbi:hypothetical protein ADEAN_000882600 [Angomonas deanei]|uniref:Uncharacterized protein n=1 Tax=Angomonas deanei TaxID=59799 RepID=A0A7G2CQN1_9TRYP|nr:hypothetical protein ADEAN_000882600 [Angomonas deanei]